jgi:hypothetical protein
MPLTHSSTVTLPSTWLQMLQQLQQQCEQLDEDLQQLWLSPDEVQLSADVIDYGASCTVYHAEVHGRPAAVKVYHHMKLAPSGPGAAPGLHQLTCKGLQRELCIIAKANQHFSHTCR